MATKKSTDTAAASTTPVEATAAVPATDRASIVSRMACGLLQSPRFCSKITDEGQQKLLVDLAVKLADKIIAAIKAPEGSEGDWTNPQGLPRRGELPERGQRVNR